VSEKNQLTELFEDLRAHDAGRAPSFETLAQPRLPALRSHAFRALLLAAAAVALLLTGGMIGSYLARRGSLEASLEREDLSASDRILLLQRAGSAYVRAANNYAAATARDDSTAIEVASRVLMGAAQAVASNGLDAGITSQLAARVRATKTGQQPQPLLWF
jgi:hypothetical protein